MVKVKRIYDPLAPDDGVRFLVDRLWPRGGKRCNWMAGRREWVPTTRSTTMRVR